MTHLKCGVRGEALQILWTIRKAYEWVLSQVNLEYSLGQKLGNGCSPTLQV